MKALLRWLTSMTELPAPRQSVSSERTCSRTSRGSVAGPAAKLNTRMGMHCDGFAGTPRILATARPRGWTFCCAALTGAPAATSHLRRNFRAHLFAAFFTLESLIDLLDPRQALPFGEPDQPHALRIAAHNRHLIHGRPDERPGRTDKHQLLPRRHLHGANRRAVAIGRLQGNDPLPAAPVYREILKRRALAEAMFRRRQNVTLTDDDERNQFLAIAELDAAHASGLAAHRAYLLFRKADRLAAVCHEDHLALPIGERNADEAVIVVQVDCNDARGARPRERIERRFFHGALTRRHEHEMLLVVLLHRQNGIDLLALLERQQIDHRLAARISARLRQLMHLQPVHLTAVRKAQDGVVSMRNK